MAEPKYELANFENKSEPGQVLQFIRIAMILDRLNGLQIKFPCREDAVAITHLETSLLRLNHRTANRQKLGVEGKQIV